MKKQKMTSLFLFLGLSSSLLSACFLTNCMHTQTAGPISERTPQSLDAVSAATSVSVYFGNNVQPAVRDRVNSLLKNVIPKFNSGNCQSGEKHLDLYFGNSDKTFLTDADRKVLKSNEGFVIRTKAAGNCLGIAVDGLSKSADFKSSRGVSYGIYAVLQDMGFKFLHPLRPQSTGVNLNFAKLEKTSRSEEPYWETRAVHLHTMHPLELTNLVNGWGPAGPQDASGWQQSLPYWSTYLEWLTAHKQNEIEWMLLWTPSAGNFNQSSERQSRLQTLTTLAKSWGVEVGVVTPVRFVQQNGWTLLRNHEARKGKANEEADNIKEILTNIDWLVKAGFTAIGGELGEGEFSSAPAANTLQELNAIADHLAAQKIPYRVKVHVSQKQFAEGYKDPGTGKDINFNYLPLYANSHVGVLPHTVQIYSLNDPAPTYENENFMDMFRFIKMAATGAVQNTKREVLFYPETAYWVSYDIDVPLFLPVYPYRRVHDLRMIAQDELSGEMKKKNARINGQVIFSSGWEWGYWFNDVITAEAAWNPRAQAPSSAAAYQEIIRDVFRLEKNSGLPALLSSISENQHQHLVLGKAERLTPSSMEKRTGIAYLSGLDSFDEIGMWTRQSLPDMFKNIVPLTQPNKFRDDWVFTLDHAFYMDEYKYKLELKPLLSGMSTVFQKDADRMKTYATQSTESLQFELQDFVDGTQITAHRANFVLNMYEARLAKSKLFNDTAYKAQEAKLGGILNSALSITQKRKNLIPMQLKDRQLLSSWESPSLKNPTDYHFGYLWTAYNLFYWQREFNKLRYQDKGGKNLCYMNIIKASELEGKPNSKLQSAEGFAILTGYLKSCAVIPESEPDLNKGW